MGTRIIELKFDDLDGTDAAHTVVFFDKGTNRRLEVDLSPENYADYILPLKQVAHGASHVHGYSNHAAKVARHAQCVLIRAWAKANDFDLYPTGRIPFAVEDAYNASLVPVDY